MMPGFVYLFVMIGFRWNEEMHYPTPTLIETKQAYMAYKSRLNIIAEHH